MPKQKILNFPIRELQELLTDCRKDRRDMIYWESLYSDKSEHPSLDDDTRAAVKKALKGLRFGKTLLEKKILSVELAILILKKRNVTWSLGVRTKKEMREMRSHFLT